MVNSSLNYFSDSDENELSALITLRTGIEIQKHQRSQLLRNIVAEACKKFHFQDPGLYVDILKKKDSLSSEFRFLISGITIGESYFFRHAGQTSLLRESLLPEMLARKRQNNDFSLRIWSAGCAEGQEIYSVVIMLYEMLPDINQWDLHFLATDINHDVLSKAADGCYREWSLRKVPENIKEKYFIRENNRVFRLCRDICQSVKFSYLNLADYDFPAQHIDTDAMDIIFCRNVFIYLESTRKQQIMTQFAKSLVPDGLLLLGPSDFVDPSLHLYTYTQTNSFAYFRRKAEVSTVDSISSDIQDSVEESFAGSNDKLEKLEKLIQMESWTDALLMIEEIFATWGESAHLWQMKAKILTGLNLLDGALQACKKSLTLDSSDKYTYLLKGIILAELFYLGRAEIAFQRAIFLDYTFSEAHYQLGLLRLKHGDREVGLKCLKHALIHARNKDPRLKVYSESRMSYKQFIEVIQSKLASYSKNKYMS